MQTLSQIRIGVGHMLIKPELNSRNAALGRLQQPDQHFRISTKHIVREPQTMPKRNREIDVSDGSCLLLCRWGSCGHGGSAAGIVGGDSPWPASLPPCSVLHSIPRSRQFSNRFRNDRRTELRGSPSEPQRSDCGKHRGYATSPG